MHLQYERKRLAACWECTDECQRLGSEESIHLQYERKRLVACWECTDDRKMSACKEGMRR
jgi:L-rhamnose mutarotase